MKTTLVLSLMFLPMIFLGQVNVDSIFLWDNDRGLSSQYLPAVGARSWGSYLMWQDSRYGDFDVYRQGVYWAGGLNGINTAVSNDPLNEYMQTYVDCEGNPTIMFAAVWEESLYTPGREQPTAIYARRYGTGFNPFLVYSNSAYSQKRPSVSCNDDGWFAVTFTRNFSPPLISSIYFYVYDNNCNLRADGYVRQRDSLLRRPPVSRVAYCDSGFVVVYDDTSSNGTCRSIYLAFYDPSFNLKVQHLKVSHRTGTDYHNEEYPAVSTDGFGRGVVVWQDYRQEKSDLYGSTFQMRPGLGTITLGSELAISTSIYDEYRPRVTMLNNNDFFTVWYEKQDTLMTDGDIWGRLYATGSLKSKFRVCADLLDQYYPDVEAERGHDTCTVTWCGVEVEAAKVPGTYRDVYCRHYRSNRETMYPLGSAITFVPDTAGGRKGWYFDDENYDDPATAWNEDPIDEPDSVYVDLEFAIMDQIQELNTNNQYLVVCAETLPVRPDTQQQGKMIQGRTLTDYEAIFLDLGYRTSLSSAGTLTQHERDEMETYIAGRNPTMIEGTDFGYYYDTTRFFKKYGSRLIDDGEPYATGNIDTLYGGEGSFIDETLAYDYQSVADNYVDAIEDSLPGYEMILYNDAAKDRWFAGRCVGWGTYWKDGTERSDVVDSFKVYSSFMLSSIKSGTHPHTYAEIYRRLLGYLGLNCQPEPITAIICSTYASEGAIMLKWQVVSDNKPTESAEGPYKLKFSPDKISSEDEFNNAQEYYQGWNTADSTVGDWRRQIIYGLPPAETLVTALKVSDEDTLWNALGAEPQVVVYGDTLTPHTIRIGETYGHYKDFLNKQEYINRRRINDTGTDYDSLFVTWNTSSIFFGFARCNFQTAGDLVIYVDTRSGGADTTLRHSSSGGKSYFFKTASDSFRPDFCFILEDDDSVRFAEWIQAKDGKAGYWSNLSYSWSGYYSEDNVINDLLYTEINLRFTRMDYTAGSPFKLVVLVQNETTNSIVNAFPIFNPLGTGVTISQYYWWGESGLQSGMVPANRGVIGIEEQFAGTNTRIVTAKLSISPNPFKGRAQIFLPAIDDRPADVTIKIFDATGRLVKNLSPHQDACVLPAVLSWEGRNDHGEHVPAGIYFCELKTPERAEVVKVIYVH